MWDWLPRLEMSATLQPLGHMGAMQPFKEDCVLQGSNNTWTEAPRHRFWILAILLCLIFLTGGSSKPNIPALILLRPICVIVAGYALLTMPGAVWRHYWAITVLAALTLALTAAHLVPLPAEIWKSLPGRDLIRQIDAFTGSGHWRPLSMVPDATANALFSLAVPVAVAGLAAQQGAGGHVRLLIMLIMLAGLSGLLGLLQASGIGLRPTGPDSDIGGLFANRNHQGLMLGLLLPMLGVAAMARVRRLPDERWPLFVVLPVAAVVLVLVVVTGSRTALALALLSGLMTPPILYGTLPASRHAKARHLRTFAIGTGLVVALSGALMLLTVFSARDQAISRIHQAFDDPRYMVWGAVTEAIPRLMPWGSGIGSYADVYQTFEPAATLRPTYSNHAHNEWLEIALTAGVPGILIALAATLLVTAAFWQSIRATGLHALFSRLGVAVIVLVALASVTDYPARTPIVAAVLAIAMVWASSARRFGNDPVRKDV